MANDRSMKDKNMAAYMKKIGVSRESRRCPVCHVVIGIGTNALFSHFAGSCRARRPSYGRVGGRA